MPTTVMTNPVVWEVPATAAPSTRALLREPFPEAVRGLTFTPAAPGLWRGARGGGPVLGDIRRRGGSERERRGREGGGGGGGWREGMVLSWVTSNGGRIQSGIACAE